MYKGSEKYEKGSIFSLQTLFCLSVWPKLFKDAGIYLRDSCRLPARDDILHSVSSVISLHIARIVMQAFCEVKMLQSAQAPEATG